MFFIQVVRDRPGGRLQFSGRGSKMAHTSKTFAGKIFLKVGADKQTVVICRTVEIAHKEKLFSIFV